MSSYVMAGNIPESEDLIKLAINEWIGQHITTHIAGEIIREYEKPDIDTEIERALSPYVLKGKKEAK